MSSAESNGERISVSREALRADLAEVKLELIDRFEKALEQKADRSRIHGMEARLAALELINAATKSILEDFIGIRRDVTSLKSWRVYTTGFLAGLTAFLTVVSALHIAGVI